MKFTKPLAAFNPAVYPAEGMDSGMRNGEDPKRINFVVKNILMSEQAAIL